MDTGLIIRKYIPSLILFIVGFFVFFNYMERSISMGIVGGWFFGGTVWGWYLTRKWFGPSNFQVFSIFWILGFCLKMMVGAAVGVIAMPVGIIQLIIALFIKGKEVSDAVNANQYQSTGNNGTPINPVINTGETWVCKACNEVNPIASSSCKGCGAYK